MSNTAESMAPPAGVPNRRITAGGLAVVLGLACLALLLIGLAAGSDGWSFAWYDEWPLITSIRAPRTLGALAAGGLLGLAGAVAQGLFRNPLADPYLLGSAAGAGLGVVLVLFVGGHAGISIGIASAEWLLRLGLVSAAFLGALAGVSLTLLLAGGAARPLVLLLGGVVVGVLLGAASDMLMLISPEALRGKQAFLLGTTGFIGWPGFMMMTGVLMISLPLAARVAGVLDALVLGEASAASLGLNLGRWRLILVALMALCTGAAVSQAGLIAFVGLVAPHLVRRVVTVRHAALLALSALAGAALLLAADVIARSVMAPLELPVGIVTAVVGGIYLMVLLRRRAMSTSAW